MISPCDYLTWCQFKQRVLELLPLDNSRLIQGDSMDSNGHSIYLVGLIRQGVIDMQTHVVAYRQGHETIYYPQDFGCEGAASSSVLPPQAQVQDCWLFKLPDPCETKAPAPTGFIGGDVGFPADNEDTNAEPWNPQVQLVRLTSENINALMTGPARFPMKEFDWERRFELVNHLVPLNDNHGRIAIDPYGYKFYVYPEVKDGWLFSVFWNGLKLDFKDTEVTPFDEPMVGAVAQFVRAHLARDVDKDLPTFASYMNPGTGSYYVARRNCYTEALERGRIKQ